MVLVKKWLFFQLFFVGNIGQENVIYDILEGKNGFPSYKNKKLSLVKKCPFFHLFFLGNIGPVNVFYDILN